MRAHPELAAAVRVIVDKIDASIAHEYAGPPIRMFIAGGIAVNFYCGSRYTGDVDASFSKRPLLDFKAMTVDYTRADGTRSFLYLDPNYNTSFALLPEDFEDDALEWPGLGNERRRVHAYVLAPVDLAVSKIARFSAQDRDDILSLAEHGLVDAGALRGRALHALGNFIGDTRPVRTNIENICRRIDGLMPRNQ